MQSELEVFTISLLPATGQRSDPRMTTAKRWGMANGYRGAQGGWIYNASLQTSHARLALVLLQVPLAHFG